MREDARIAQRTDRRGVWGAEAPAGAPLYYEHPSTYRMTSSAPAVMPVTVAPWVR